MQKDVIICGSGGSARDIAYHLVSEGFNIGGYIGREVDNSGRALGPYLGTIDDFKTSSDCLIMLTMGQNPGRAEIFDLLKERGFQFLSFIHPTATVVSDAVLSEGVYIGPYCIVGSGARIGSSTFINKYVNIGHDASLGKSCCVSPFVSIGGGAEIMDNVSIWTRSTIKPSVKIASGSEISAHTYVRKDVVTKSLVFQSSKAVTKVLK